MLFPKNFPSGKVFAFADATCMAKIGLCQCDTYLLKTADQQCTYFLADWLGYFNRKDENYFKNIYLKSRTIICSLRNLHQEGRSEAVVTGRPLGRATLQDF